MAERERRKAIRTGDNATALAAAVVQYYVDQASKNGPSQKLRW